MDNDTATLMREINAFEKQLSVAGSPRRAKATAPRKNAKLAAEIAEVDRILAGCGETGMDVDMESGMDWEESGMDWEEPGMELEEDAMSYMDIDLDSDDLLDDDLLDDDYDEPAMMGYASVADPSGIEEEITDDRFSEMERLLNDESIVDEEHTFNVAPTDLRHTAGLKQASTRLDKLASYIENQVVEHGENKQWLKVALRIDKMADGIDSRIKAAQEAK
jgi:hypothetical protein